jgi:hypothetical protein
LLRSQRIEMAFLLFVFGAVVGEPAAFSQAAPLPTGIPTQTLFTAVSTISISGLVDGRHALSGSNILVVLVALYSVHALAKFGIFFVLSYGRRRQALDRAYAGKTSATKATDVFLLALSIALVFLLAIRGVDHLSFLTGLLVGMTLIQIYFHKFSVPLSEAEAPEAPSSPIKTMSYAIQAAPSRPWKELVVIACLLAWSLCGLAQQSGLLGSLRIRF